MEKGRTGDEGRRGEGRLERGILRKEQGMKKGRTGDEGRRGTVRERDTEEGRGDGKGEDRR